jgi:hypothetical protein
VTEAEITGRGSIVTTISKSAPSQLGGPGDVGVTVYVISIVEFVRLMGVSFIVPDPLLPLLPVQVKVVPGISAVGAMFNAPSEQPNNVPAGTAVPTGNGFTVTATAVDNILVQPVIEFIATTPSGLVIPVPKALDEMFKLVPVPPDIPLTGAPAPELSNIW